MMPDVVRALLDKGRATGLVDGTLVRFATVGAITTILDVVLFGLLAVGMDIPPVPANVVSYSCGIITSFALNRTWTFGIGRSAGGAERHAFRFVLSNLAGLLLSSGLVAVFTLLLPDFVAKLISVPLVFIWNYSVARFWVFR